MNKLFAPFLPPWVETGLQPAFYDMESGTVLQQTARMYAKVQQLTRLFNELSSETKATVEEYITKFVELKDFVDTYFDNLDVQEEINNKLDSMAEAGTLQEIIAEYLNATTTWGFDSVADMKSSTNLIEGSFAQTLGYYSVNDGGSALYKIRKVTNDDTVDDAFLIEIGDPENELVAELIIKNEVNIKQLGARPQATDGTKYDIAGYITKYLNYLDLGNTVSLFIPSGVWYSTPLVIARENGFNIHGEEQFILHNNRGTIISSLVDNQATIWTLGDGLNMTSNFVFKNLCFTTADYVWDVDEKVFKEDTIKTIDDVCLRIQSCQFGDTDNLYFQHINGKAFGLTSSWEIRYRKMYFRDIDALGSSVMEVEKAIAAIPNSGVNASMFDNVMFEQVLGDLIVCGKGCKFQNTTFGVINFEDYRITRDGVEYTTITDETASTVEASATHFSMIKLPESGCEIHNVIVNNIQMNNVAFRYSTINGTDYVYDRIVSTDGDYNVLQLIINNIDIWGINKDIIMLYSRDNVDQRSSFVVNNIYNPSGYKFKFDVINFTYIRMDGRNYLHLGTAGFPQKLNKSITPFYELVANRSTGPRFLVSDSDALNEAGLVVRIPDSSNTPCRFTVASNTIHIRAKIPNGETAKIAVGPTHWQSQDLVGTGNFEIYEITLGSSYKIGDPVQIGFASANTASECLLDWFIN